MTERRRFFRTGLRRLLAAAAMAVTGASVAPPPTAGAAPLLAANSVTAELSVLQVRDGCGRGMRFSERRGMCVEDFDGPPGYGPPGYDRRPPPPPVVYERRPQPPGYGPGPGYRGPEPDCGRGMRFSNSRQACVRIEGAVDDRGNNEVAAGALVGGVIGAVVGTAIQNEANRQPPVQQQPAQPGARRP